MDPVANSVVQRSINNEDGIDFTESLPAEVCLKIFSYLNSIDLTRTTGVNKACQVLASDEALWKALPFPEIGFGKADWEKHLGNIGEAPPLPVDIHKILKSPCPFWPGKKVEETHMLALVPETVNNKPLNLITLGELVKTPKADGHATKYNYISNAIINAHGEATAKSHWVLMTKDVIAGSIDKSYLQQQTLIATLARDYTAPNARDAVVCLFTEFVRSGKRLFNDKPWTYTRCEEMVNGAQVRVGGFSSAGLIVDTFDLNSFGMAALRKFS